MNRDKQKIVHFCFGMTSDFGGRPFGFSHYLAVRSAWEVLRPAAMVMHYCHQPTGEWWERARPMLQLHQVRAIEGIYGFPAKHPAHRADIVRLAALIAMGGVYLDTDVLVLKSFDVLGNPDFAAAWEFTGDGRLVGLSNAVLVAAKQSQFARLCLEGHDPKRSLWSGFRANGRDHNYIEMSVRYPAMLASLCPAIVHGLPQQTFLWADWSDMGLGKLFERDVEVPESALALHLWESHSWEKYLSRLTPERVLKEDTTFHREARRFLPDVPVREVAAGQVLNLDFSEMDAICAEVDFVHSKQNSAGLVGKIRRAFRALRDEWNAPLKADLSRVQQEVENVQAASGLLLPSRFAGTNTGADGRFGIHDGSAEILEQHLPEGEFSALILSSDGREPGVCEALMKNPHARCVWGCGDLKRAHQISKWIRRTGAQGRCVFHENLLGRCESSKLFDGVPDVFVDVRMGCADWIWVGNKMPKFILRCGAPASGYREEMEGNGYKLLESSRDGCFTLFSRMEGGGGLPRGVKRMLSIYGDGVLMDNYES
jgi:hypothetical protein